MKHLAAILVAIIFIQFFTPTARAFGQDKIVVVPEFGYDNIITAERWAPLRFNITSPVQAVSGRLIVRYVQDASQSVEHSTTFSVSPGVLTPVDLGVCFPSFIRGLSLEIISSSGKVLLRTYLDFSNPARAKGIEYLPPTVSAGPLTILSIGNDSLAQAGADWSKLLIIPDGQDWRGVDDKSVEQPPIDSRLRISSMEPESLYSFWAAYDGVVAVVVRASVVNLIPARALRALLQWQQAGGHLIVVVDDASSMWRRFLLEGSQGNFATMEEFQEVATGKTLELFEVHAEKHHAKDLALATPSETISARPVHLTQWGRDHGWKQSFLLPELSGKSLVASGPCGLGFITLLGFDPSRATIVRSRKAAGLAWGALLDQLLTDPTRNNEDQNQARMSWWNQGSGLGLAESNAIGSLAESTLQGSGIGWPVIIVVLGVLMVYILGIGPIDAIVLKRCHLRHWSWLSALVWIAAASIIAIQIPNLSLSDKTHFGRATLTDAVLDDSGQPITSWTTGVSTIYAGNLGTFGPVDNRPGAWWRGVSPLPQWSMRTSTPSGALGRLRLEQRPVADPGGTVLSTTPTPFIQRGWTARALVDVAPEPPPFRVALTETESSRQIRIEQGSRQFEVLSVRVTIGSKVWDFDDLKPGDAAELIVEDARRVSTSNADESDARFDNGLTVDFPKAISNLPHAQQRLRAMEAWRNSEMTALVRVEYRSTAFGFKTRGATSLSEHGVVRLVVPIVQKNTEQSP